MLECQAILIYGCPLKPCMIFYALQGHSGEHLIIIYVLQGHYKEPLTAIDKHETPGRGDCAHYFYLESTDLYRKNIFCAYLCNGPLGVMVSGR